MEEFKSTLSPQIKKKKKRLIIREEKVKPVRAGGLGIFFLKVICISGKSSPPFFFLTGFVSESPTHPFPPH
jgi:hypothetical protein